MRPANKNGLPQSGSTKYIWENWKKGLPENISGGGGKRRFLVHEHLHHR